jgi:hypothetical protein
MSFIFTCKEKTHPWLTGTVKNSYPQKKERQEWNGRHHLIYPSPAGDRGGEIRDGREMILVKYIYMEIENEEKKEVTYRNNCITNKAVTEDNAALIASCGRAQWKTGNEHNNVLKNHGYNLEYNFGQGKEHASEIFCLLNLPAFLFHPILDYADEEYQKACASIGRGDEFFSYL